MSELQARYGLTEDQIKNLVRDGKMSSTVVFHDEVYCHYKSLIGKGMKSSEAVDVTSIKFNIGRSRVYSIISDFK